MNNTTLYHEVQRFRQWWFWLIILAPLAFGVANVWMNGTDDLSIYPFILIPLLVILFLSAMKLDMKIASDGVYVKYFPLMLKARHIEWSDINKAYTREYSPLMEYGGWGIKGIASNRAYNVSGRHGLQLELKDGNKILIGTQRGAEVDEALMRLGKWSSNAIIPESIAGISK